MEDLAFIEGVGPHGSHPKKEKEKNYRAPAHKWRLVFPKSEVFLLNIKSANVPEFVTTKLCQGRNTNSQIRKKKGRLKCNSILTNLIVLVSINTHNSLKKMYASVINDMTRLIAFPKLVYFL